MQNIVILGGGSVGSVLAAALSLAPDLNLTMVGRKYHIDKIGTNGLFIDGDIKKHFQIKCVEKIDFNLKNTLLIITTKINALRESIKEISDHLDSTTHVLLTQNGTGFESEIQDLQNMVSKKHIFRSIIGFGAIMTAPANVQYQKGVWLVDERFKHTPFHLFLEKLFLPLRYSERIEEKIWKKLIINSIFNPLSVIFQVNNAAIAGIELNKIKQMLLEEGLQVAGAFGFNPKITLDQINQVTASKNFTSMYQDFHYKRISEIDYINGAIVKFGKQKDIKTECHRFIVEIIKGMTFFNQNDLIVPFRK